jgi:hypothetical protein
LFRQARGQQETWEYYDACFQRDRNTNLFIADQDVDNDDGATNTRQNPNGNRSGYECPEERDYFPYWHPTPWTDIAVLSSQTKNCEYYKAESANRKPKSECVEYFQNSSTRKHASEANNEQACKQKGGTWTEFQSYLEIIPNVNDETSCRIR